MATTDLLKSAQALGLNYFEDEKNGRRVHVLLSDLGVPQVYETANEALQFLASYVPPAAAHRAKPRVLVQYEAGGPVLSYGGVEVAIGWADVHAFLVMLNQG